MIETRITMAPGGRRAGGDDEGAWSAGGAGVGGFHGLYGAGWQQCWGSMRTGRTAGITDGVLDGTVAEPILGREAKVPRLKEITARLGVTPEAAIAVGDGANDLGMLGQAGDGCGGARQARGAGAVRVASEPRRPDGAFVPARLFGAGFAR